MIDEIGMHSNVSNEAFDCLQFIRTQNNCYGRGSRREIGTEGANVVPILAVVSRVMLVRHSAETFDYSSHRFC
jgi:hypothetical protein